MNQSERIGELFFRFTRNELSASEKDELEAWRNADPEHEHAFLEETYPEQIRKNYIGMQKNKEETWKILQARFPETFLNKPSPVRILGLSVRRFSAAAAILLIFALYFLLRGPSGPNTTDAILLDPDGVANALDDFHRGWLDARQLFRIQHNEQGVLEFTPPKDSTSPLSRNYKLATRSSKLILNLVQGIRISLNLSSSVTYPQNTERDTMRVMVNGETYIEVKRPESSPLLITTGIGTDSANQIMASQARLNIQATSDTGLVRATLLDGQATIRLAGKTYIMSPGQQVLISNRKFSVVDRADSSAVIHWLK